MSGFNDSSFGDTLTSGIQDITALLPLLGTEQCEKHVGSALHGGYFYAGAAPLSLFGALGVVKAAASTLLATISWPFNGAKWVTDAGFTPPGSVLSMASMSTKLGENHLYMAEKKMFQMLEEEHVDHLGMIDCVKWSGWRTEPGSPNFFGVLRSWNVSLIFISLIAAALSLTPYIHLFFLPEHDLLTTAFPCIRAVGSFLCCVAVQLALQRRIHRIITCRLALIKIDPAANGGRKTKRIKGNPEKTAELYLRDIVRARGHTGTCSSHPRRLLGHLFPFIPFRRDPPPLATDPEKASSSTTSPLTLLPDHTSAGQNRTPKADINVVNDATDSTPLTATMLLHPQEIQSSANVATHVTDDSWKLAMSAIATDWQLVAYQLLLTSGIPMVVIGYIGCFYIVSKSSTPPYIWLAIEVFLAVLRMVLWGWNPRWDEPEGILLMLGLTTRQPLVTSILTPTQLEESRTPQPFVVYEESEFLDSITSFTGPLKCFESETVSLFHAFVGDKGGKRYLYTTVHHMHTGINCTLRLDATSSKTSKSILFASTTDTEPRTATLYVTLGELLDQPFLNEDLFARILRHTRTLAARLFGQARINGLRLGWGGGYQTTASENYLVPGLGSESDVYSSEEKRLHELKLQLCDQRAQVLTSYSSHLRDLLHDVKAEEVLIMCELASLLESFITELFLCIRSLDCSALLDKFGREQSCKEWICRMKTRNSLEKKRFEIRSGFLEGRQKELVDRIRTGWIQQRDRLITIRSTGTVLNGTAGVCLRFFLCQQERGFDVEELAVLLTDWNPDSQASRFEATLKKFKESLENVLPPSHDYLWLPWREKAYQREITLMSKRILHILEGFGKESYNLPNWLCNQDLAYYPYPTLPRDDEAFEYASVCLSLNPDLHGIACHTSTQFEKCLSLIRRNSGVTTIVPSDPNKYKQEWPRTASVASMLEENTSVISLLEVTPEPFAATVERNRDSWKRRVANEGGQPLRYTFGFNGRFQLRGKYIELSSGAECRLMVFVHRPSSLQLTFIHELTKGKGSISVAHIPGGNVAEHNVLSILHDIPKHKPRRESILLEDLTEGYHEICVQISNDSCMLYTISLETVHDTRSS